TVTAKKQIQQLIRRMPDDCSFEDVQSELYVAEKVRKAMDSVHKGYGIPHEEVKKRLARGLST
ncbi:MAG: hypothetical protein ABSH20_09450, partial [Tepidisphaeraceae bacterium]